MENSLQPPKRKMLALVSILAVLVALPLTVLFSQQQQDTRQRASGMQTAFFFSLPGTVIPLTQTNSTLNTPQTVSFSLDTKGHIVSGFDVTIQVANVDSLQITEGPDAAKFNISIHSFVSPTTIRFSKVTTDTNTPISGTLHLLNITGIPTTSTSLTVASSNVASGSGPDLLSVENPTLSITSITGGGRDIPPPPDTSLSSLPITASIAGPDSGKVRARLTYSTTVVSSSGIKSSETWVTKEINGRGTRVTNSDIFRYNRINFNCTNAQSASCIWYKIGSGTSSSYTSTVTFKRAGTYKIMVGAEPNTNDSKQKLCSGNPYVTYNPTYSTAGLVFTNCGPSSVKTVTISS